MYGMGPESRSLTNAVHASLPTVKECLPIPTDDAIWSTYVRLFWPKGGGRTAEVTMVKNGSGQVDSAETAPLKACVQKKANSWVVPDATGQGDGGSSYLFTSAGWYWRSD